MMKTTIACLALSCSAFAATVESVSVRHPDRYYHVKAMIHLRAARGAAFHAATEFEKVAARSPMIESTRRIGSNELVSRIRLCVMWYCKTVRQVMRYSADSPEWLHMRVVPGRGDLKAGVADWRFVDKGRARTTLVFTARLVPDFWVPPLIGPWAMSRALRKQIAATAKAIEQIADTAQDSAAQLDHGPS